MNGPLDGLLVFAIEQAVAAPMCTMRLADAGARVIKIEREEGETARHYDKSVHGTSAYFAWLNRGKQSAVLNLKDSEGLRLTHEIISKADIFIQNLAPGASARLGLGAEKLIEEHPGLIVVDIVGYKQSTPAHNKRAYDMLVQAESGLCSVTGTAQEAVKVGISIADVATALNAYSAILQALFEKQQTGRGRALEISMFDSVAEWMGVPLLHFDYANRVTPRTGLSHASIFPYHVAKCSDGEIVIVVQNPLEWERFCSGVLRRPALARDARFADNPLRVENRDALINEIDKVFRLHMREEMIKRLEANKLAWGDVSTIEGLSNHDALSRVAVSLPGEKFCNLPISPVADIEGGRRVPALGEHTEMIKREFAVHTD